MKAGEWGLMILLIYVPISGAVSMVVGPVLVKKLGLENVSWSRVAIINMATFGGVGLVILSFTERDQVPLVLGIGLLVLAWFVWKRSVRRAESEPKP